MRYSFSALATISVFLSSCGSSDAAKQQTETSEADAVAGVFGLNLSGAWCHKTTVAGGEVEKDNITYIFKDDGTLLYQVSNMSSDIDGEGVYSINGDSISIEPQWMMFDFKIKSFDDQSMVIGNSYADLHWSRGSCE